MKRVAALVVTLILLLGAIPHAYLDGRMNNDMEFKEKLRNKILEVINAWPAKDQYAIMMFIYANEMYEYKGYENIPEFLMLYRCESDIDNDHNPYFASSSDAEERWNPAFWDYDVQVPIISFDTPNAMADGLIAWYESMNLENVGQDRDEAIYDEHYRYIGTGPIGLQELLNLVTEITAEIQSEGILEQKFGKKIPIILADFEFAWYMVKATKQANPNGEAETYLSDCISQGWVHQDLIE